MKNLFRKSEKICKEIDDEIEFVRGRMLILAVQLEECSVQKHKLEQLREAAICKPKE